VYDLLIGLPD